MKTAAPCVTLLSALLVAGCHAPDPQILRPLTQLNPGQTKSEVIALLGAPSTVMSPGNNTELLKYRFYQPRGLLKSTLRTDYIVRLENGHVAAYGTEAEMRPAKPVVILSNDKNVNVNIKTDGASTNAPTTVSPRVNINAN